MFLYFDNPVPPDLIQEMIQWLKFPSEHSSWILPLHIKLPGLKGRKFEFGIKPEQEQLAYQPDS